jgi:hypothetical protein
MIEARGELWVTARTPIGLVARLVNNAEPPLW